LQGYIDWSMSRFQDPVLGPAITQMGATPDKVMQRIQAVGATPGGLSQLIEESKLGSQNFANLVKERTGQQITLRGQDVQAKTSRGVVKTFKPKQRGAVKTLPSVVSVILRLLKIWPRLRARGTELAKNKVEARTCVTGCDCYC
jgi:hypothetical protein